MHTCMYVGSICLFVILFNVATATSCIQCPIYSMLHTVSYIWYTHSGLFNAAVPGAGEETAEKRKEDHKEVKRTGH